LPASVLVACLARATAARAADAMAECIGQNERSLELRKQGKLLDARRELAACSAAPCPDAIQQACRARMGDLNGAIPSVVLDVKDAAGQDLLDAQLSIDGQGAGAVGVTARQLDPGRHVFRVEVPGRPAVEKAIVLREGDRDRHESVLVGTSPPAASAGAGEAVSGGASSPETATGSAPASPPAPERDGRDAPSPASSSGDGGASGLRTAGWIVGGAGVVGLAVGGTIALLAKSSYDGAAGCEGTVCDAAGLRTRNSARSKGDVATVVFVAGATTLAVGIVLWIVAPRAHDAASGVRGGGAWRFGLTPNGAMAEGRF
jgi:hypothetical protein